MKIAIIPARKGSKRCPEKNISLINGLPLYQRAINTALKSIEFEKIIVTTNDEFIIDNIESNPKVELDIRDEQLSNSTSTLIDVVRGVIIKKKLSKEDVICLMTVTNPLTEYTDIKGGMKLYRDQLKKNTVISVCEMEYPIELTWKLDKTINKLYNTHNIESTRKQDFTPSYRWNDSFIIDSVESFMDTNRNNFGYNPTPYIMPPERSFFIDYPWQLEIIKMLIQNKTK